MTKISVNDLQPGTFFSQPVYLDEEYLLLAPEAPVTEDLISRLRTWHYDYVLSEGRPASAPPASGEAVPSGANTLDADVKEEERTKASLEFFRATCVFTERMFTDFVQRGELQRRALSDKIREIGDFVRDNKQYILRLNLLDAPGRSYVVVQSVKTAILSLVMGQLMRLPPFKLMELGEASLLHELGMLRLPRELFLSDRQLTPEERRAITAHPVVGYKILRQAEFPSPVCLAVLESHEHVDGSGYPRGLAGDSISGYARILAVASAYCAQITERPFRSARNGFEAMADLLQNRGKRYDANALKAAYTVLSLYPLGTFVQLKNGAQGMVVETSPVELKSPVVKLLRGPGGEPYIENPRVRTSTDEHRIVGALSPQEAADLSNP